MEEQIVPIAPWEKTSPLSRPYLDGVSGSVGEKIRGLSSKARSQFRKAGGRNIEERSPCL